jgi:ATP-dependent helicase HrpB
VTALPIDPLLPAIGAALSGATRLVLVAPPGAGKTTRVPLALLDAPWAASGRLLLLEPRRLAARAAARRLAQQRGESVGQVVGHRMRDDTRVGPDTRLEVVTEGVLTRMLQHDPFLEGVAGILFDEFHERSLHADLGLALALHAQRLVREDLRLVVMSATLDGAAVAARIDAPVLESEGRAYPVDTRYRPRREREWVEDAVARVIREALADTDGDVLAFLPGAAEIRRCAARLGGLAGVEVHPLYGDLPSAAQDAAILPSPAGRRKVVLATNIAETSLTIEGVRVVVDGGLARAPRFSPRTGMTRLDTVRIARASADQRRGRAGRVAPGVCYRLWDAHDEAQLTPREVPEILSADLAPLALELALAGLHDAAELTWMDAPPAGALAQGRALLRDLDALDADGRITPHGRAVAAVGAHPRLAHLALRARDAGHRALGAALGALLEARDLLRGAPGAAADADVRTRLALLSGQERAGADADAIRRARHDATRWRERLGGGAPGTLDPDAVGPLLAQAFPDRIARARREAPGRYLLSNGTGAAFTTADPLSDEPWLVIIETDGRTPEAGIRSAAPITLEEIRSVHARHLRVEDLVHWDDRSERLVAVRRESLGALTLHERQQRDVDPATVAAAVADTVRARGLSLLPWSDAASDLRARLAFVHAHDATWPAVDDAALLARLDEWLTPHLGAVRSAKDLAALPLHDALLGLLDWSQRAELERAAPTHVAVPSGSRIRVDYREGTAPSIAVRLQEVFGMASSPTVLGGRVPVTLHLLSPARRPVQVTTDLASFWRGSYAEVRKEMRGRYPRHDWPEDPAAASAHRGQVRRRS